MGHHEANGMSDEWYTPRYVFDALDVEFDMDVAHPVNGEFCCVPANEKITQDALSDKCIWSGFVWMNPPFGGRNAIVPWLDKIYNHGNGIALTPDRTSAPWWQDISRKADLILFVAGKIKFIQVDGQIGTKPGNGTTLFAFGDIAVNALYKAEANGLGITFKRPTL